MMYAYAYSKARTQIARIPVQIRPDGDEFDAVVPAADVPDGTFDLDFAPEYENAAAHESGYMVAPRGGPYVKSSYMMCSFRPQPDCEHIIEGSALPIFGVRRADACFVAIVTGMRCDYDTVVGVRGGIHYIFPRFRLDGERPYEDIAVRYCTLRGDNADYCGMARRYRRFQLDRGACVPLKIRAQTNPYLRYAAESMNVRIRMGMKPVPTPVLTQTPETEPEMVVSCTFDRMRDLIGEFKRQGIDKAEFCLIGWNVKGHDGRYPQLFPVEPALGGEQKLRALIRYGQQNGYQMTCHTNSSDAYAVSELWNPDDILMHKNGTLSVDENAWSGGRMYQLCPAAAARQAAVMLPKVAALGFRGIHYIDVISLHPPRKCCNPRHPLNRRDSAACNGQIMALTQRLMGGFSSEGAFDINIGSLDFALLVHSDETLAPRLAMCDRVIPLWELVYHGIVLHNTSWETGTYRQFAGAPPENECKRLKNIEFGGRPLAYFHMEFHGHADEIGKGLTTATDAQMARSVSELKGMAEDFRKLSYLQYEFMDRHEAIADGVFRTTYSDGSRVTVDYHQRTYRLEKA